MAGDVEDRHREQNNGTTTLRGDEQAQPLQERSPGFDRIGFGPSAPAAPRASATRAAAGPRLGLRLVAARAQHDHRAPRPAPGRMARRVLHPSRGSAGDGELVPFRPAHPGDPPRSAPALWYRYAPRQSAHAHRSQLRLEIESVLRAWLLHTYRRRLYAMSFGDLCALAQPSRRRDRAPFAFAGLWERWRDRSEGETVETFTIITTEPNELVAPVHNRMPVVLSPEDHDRWLDPKAPGAPELLTPCPSEELEAVPVSPWVNNPAHDEARCIEPLT